MVWSDVKGWRNGANSTSLDTWKPPILLPSDDGCESMLKSEFPEVNFIQSEENLGFGRCNNLGFEQAKGDVVLLINPDTEVRGNAVQLMLDALETLPEAGMVGARLLNTDGTLQTSSVHSFPTPINQVLDSNFLWLHPRRQ